MLWLRTAIAILLLLLGGFCLAVNAWIFWRSAVSRKRAPSVIPFVAGLLASVGLVLLPFYGTMYWFWIPLALDWGGLPGILVAWKRGAFR